MTEKIEFKRITHWSKDYRKAIYLRYQLLRQPLGLKFSRAQFEGETEQIHIVGKLQDEIVASLIFIPYRDKKLRMRQVAVSSRLQGSGIGKNLVIFAEELARELGYQEIFLHARDYVIEFYQKLGYRVYGKEFIEVKIPHHKMRKLL